MGGRDQDFVRAMGLPIAQLAAAVGKSRQTVFRGVTGAREYFKASDFARMLDYWESSPGLRLLAKDTVLQFYPEYADAVITVATASSNGDFNPVVPGEYWFVTGDLGSFRSENFVCAEVLMAICKEQHAEVKIFVNIHDVDGAVKIRDDITSVLTRVYRCNAQLGHLATTLLRIDTDGKLVLFAVTERGFVALARNEASRVRVSLHSILIQDSEEQTFGVRASVKGSGRSGRSADVIEAQSSQRSAGATISGGLGIDRSISTALEPA